MTNNTIPNVPRDLLERAWRALANSATGREIGAYLDADPCAPECAETCARASMCSTCSATLSAPSSANHVEDVRAMVDAPSPAGVDGLEVVGWYRMDDRKAITPYPSVCATWHKMGVKVGAAYSDSAQAIIDWLRGEVADLHTTMMAAAVEIQEHWAAHCDEEGYGPANLMHRLERGIASQYGYSAETLVRLESQRDQQAQRIGELEGLLRAESARVDFLDAYIVTADATSTGKVAILADSGTLRECIDAAMSAGKEGE